MKKRVFWVFFLLALYLSTINQVPNLLPKTIDDSSINNDSEKFRSGLIGVEVGVSDSVSVSVIRNRWYGKIYENGETSTLFLFKLFKLPLKYYWFNFAYLHGLFLLSLIIVLKGGFKNKNKMAKVKLWEFPLVFLVSLLVFAFLQLWGMALGFTVLYWMVKRNIPSKIPIIKGKDKIREELE